MTDHRPRAPAPAPASTRRERTGWYFYDWANSAFSTTVITVFLGPFLTAVAEQAAGCSTDADTCRRHGPPAGHRGRGRLVLPVPGVAVGVPERVRAAGDRARSPTGRRTRSGCWPRRRYTGAGATVGDGLRHRRPYLLGGALFLIANISFGAAWWSTTRSCRSWVAPTSGTPSPAGLGAGLPRRRAAAGAQPGRGDGFSATATPSAPWTWPGGRSCRPACGGRCSPWCRCGGCGTGRRWPSARTAATCSPTASGSCGAPCAA